MKKTNLNVRFCNALVLVAALTFFIGCSRDDDNPRPNSGSIDVATGTFKGIFDIGEARYSNAILIVTKVDNSRLKFEAKSGEPYSKVPPRTIRAKADVPGLVGGDDAQGAFGYQIEDKKLTLIVNTLEVPYSFEGEKQ